MIADYAPVKWEKDKLILLDQRKLPHIESFIEIDNFFASIDAIRDMVVRGAPCIGFSAIFGLALWLKNTKEVNQLTCRKACDLMISARPTAVNLSFEVNRCLDLMLSELAIASDRENIYHKIVDFGLRQISESLDKNTRMAEIAFDELIKIIGDRKWKLMTHCNTGFLACGSLGTALGVISYSHHKGYVEHVMVDETRPFLQGSRLTAFELSKENIPHSIVVEGAASYLLSNKKVDAIFVGADRIAANGDTANKIGTSTLAIVAHYYQVPFYVVAPISSFDPKINDGGSIEIELRAEDEITSLGSTMIAPRSSRALNPSFDITDHKLITGIICEKGLINPKNPKELLKVINS